VSAPIDEGPQSTAVSTALGARTLTLMLDSRKAADRCEGTPKRQSAGDRVRPQDIVDRVMSRRSRCPGRPTASGRSGSSSSARLRGRSSRPRESRSPGRSRSRMRSSGSAKSLPMPMSSTACSASPLAVGRGIAPVPSRATIGGILSRLGTCVGSRPDARATLIAAQQPLCRTSRSSRREPGGICPTAGRSRSPTTG
jgi:hypothetical protein